MGPLIGGRGRGGGGGGGEERGKCLVTWVVVCLALIEPQVAGVGCSAPMQRSPTGTRPAPEWAASQPWGRLRTSQGGARRSSERRRRRFALLCSGLCLFAFAWICAALWRSFNQSQPNRDHPTLVARQASWPARLFAQVGRHSQAELLALRVESRELRVASFKSRESSESFSVES